MKREKTIYEGPMVLGIIILVTAHFMGLCLNGLCSDDWLIRNLILGTAVEFFMFIYLHKQINEGAKTLYRETRNLGLIVNYYQKIRGYAFIGFFYVITFCMFPNTRKDNTIMGTILVAVILLIFSASVILQTTNSINRIKNRRSWNNKKI